MQKIIIKNFRAIEYAEIELKKVLVLIGAQASGKSTIAKLIYFFKTIQDDFFVEVYEKSDWNIDNLIRTKFIEFFGGVNSNFEVEFHYNSEKKIKIHRIDDVEIRVDYTTLYDSNEELKLWNKVYELNELKRERENSYKSNLNLILSKIINKQKEIYKYIESIFFNKQDDKFYVIAGRNVTVSYSNIFSQYLNTKIQIELKESSDNKRGFNDSTDEQLMLDFIRRVELIKQRFNVNHTFQGLIDYQYDLDKILQEEKINKSEFEQLNNKIEKILKGKYQISDNYERLILENGKTKSIALSDASSGQQEVIRILQDLFLLTFDKRKFLRIIEEPEAHLFPIAQKELIELLALAVNYQPENQLIIATHSPYILSVFNNLLFANEVATKDESLQGEVSEIIDKDFWLKAEDFSAYTLGGEEAYCESIMSDDRAMIDQNYLDEVSEMLGMEFNALLELYRSTFKSKRR